MIGTSNPADEPIRRGEMVLVRRAFLNGWPVPASERRRIVARLSAVLDDPRRSARDKQKALETLAIIGRSDTGIVQVCNAEAEQPTRLNGQETAKGAS